MDSGPPRIIEALVACLIPPACRTTVLGDLCERYTSTTQYLIDVARTLPFVLASQIRRSTNLGLVLLQLAMLLIAFQFAWMLLRPSPSVSAAIPGTILIPVFVAMIVLILRTVYRQPGLSVRKDAVVDAALAIGCAVGSQVLLAIAIPGWTLPVPVMLAGGALSILWLSLVGAPKRPGLHEALVSGRAISPEELRQRSQEFGQIIRYRNIRESVACVLVIGFFAITVWRATSMVPRVGSGLVLMGALYVMIYLNRRGSASPMPSGLSWQQCLRFHRSELERQRDLLDSIWQWYLLPLIPGLSVLTLGGILARRGTGVLPLLVVVSISFLVGRLNARASRRLQQEIEAVSALEKPGQEHVFPS